MFKEVLEEWKKVGFKYFWGDYLDSRFYIANLISKKKSELILDIGCGAGVLLRYANSKFKIGVDSDYASLRAGHTLYPSLNLIQADVRYLPFRDEYFENVLAIHIISAIGNKNDRELVCNEINRILKIGGDVIIVGSNRRSKHFRSTHSNEQRLSYPHYSEILDNLKNNFEVSIEGYGSYSRYIMAIIKRIVYSLPVKIINTWGVEEFFFKILRSREFLKDGRSYIIICKKK